MIEEHSYTYYVILLFSLFIIKVILSRIVPHEPLQAFRFYCTQLALKVNKPANSQQQRVVAGAVAMLITLPPILLILWLFADFIAINWMWEALLLYMALGSPSVFKDSAHIADALIDNNKVAAKSVLSRWVLRDSQVLSNMGLAKATIEMLLLRTSQGIIGVGFYFIIGGGLCALAYRLLLEMHYSWNSKQPEFTHFGKTVSTISNILQWFPSRLFTLVLIISSLGRNALACLKGSSHSWFSLNNNALLQSFAVMLNIQLAGVAMYSKHKVRRVAFHTTGRAPEPIDINNALTSIRLCLVILALSLLTTAILPWLLTQP